MDSLIPRLRNISQRSQLPLTCICMACWQSRNILTSVSRINKSFHRHWNGHKSYSSKNVLASESSERRKTSMGHVKPFEEIPGPKGIYTWSYIGFLLQFKPFTTHSVDQFMKRIIDWNKEYGEIFRQRLGNEWFVYVTNPEDIEKVFRSDRRYPYRGKSPLFSVYEKRRKKQPGLLSLNGEAWQEVRSPTQKFLLRTPSVAKYAPLMSDIADEFVEKFHGKARINNVLYHLMEFSTECVGKLCFNKRLGCITKGEEEVRTETMHQVETLFECFAMQFLIFPWYLWFETPYYKRFETAADFIFEQTRMQINEHLTIRRQKNHVEDEADPSLLSDLLTKTDLSPDSVEKTLFDVLLGGIDSTANAIVFVLFFLAKHQDKQDKLYREVVNHIDEKGIMKYQVLQDLPYLKACLYEAFRLVYPITAGTTRSLDTDIVLRGYRIPADTQIHLCSGIAGLNSAYFEDPMEFIPERWSRGESGRTSVNQFAHIPFGFGPRKCIGHLFATQNIYTCVAKLIRNFRLTLPEGVTCLPYRYKTFATPSVPVDFILEKRT